MAKRKDVKLGEKQVLQSYLVGGDKVEKAVKKILRKTGMSVSEAIRRALPFFAEWSPAIEGNKTPIKDE